RNPKPLLQLRLSHFWYSTPFFWSSWFRAAATHHVRTRKTRHPKHDAVSRGPPPRSHPSGIDERPPIAPERFSSPVAPSLTARVCRSVSSLPAVAVRIHTFREDLPPTRRSMA